MAKVHENSKLTFIKAVTGYTSVYKCECGTEKVLKNWDVSVKGKTKSCGCYKIKSDVSRHLTHGLSKHPLYATWKSMIDRCYNKGNKQYVDYGGRGVSVCDEWRNDFLNYYNWALNNGWVKGNHIDKDKIGDGLIYSPKTCSIITRKENNNNKRDNVIIEYNGFKGSIRQIADMYGVRYALFRERIISYGWTIEKALNTPSRQKRTSNQFVT